MFAFVNRVAAQRAAIVFLGLLLFAGVLYTAVGVYRTEFGAYGDEGMHYVTGLMIRDFVLSPDQWLHPIAFAKQYYLHFPKVGLGNWPPGFPMLQTLWSLPFGESRASLLIFMTAMTSVLALLVFQATAPRFGWLPAFLGAAMLLATPLTQSQTALIMAEIPLAIAGYLAMLLFARFLRSESWADALWFGILTSAAILIKGNAWSLVLMTGFAVLFTGRLKVLLWPKFWTAAAIIGGICVPYSLLTMHIVRQGWNSSSGRIPLADYGPILWVHLRLAAEIYGYPLSIVALAGIAACWLKRDVLWRTAAAYVVAVIVFHSLVPTSVESRKLFQLVPVIAVFIVAGLDAISRALPERLHPKPLLYATAALLFIVSEFRPLEPFHPGFGELVQRAQAVPGSRDTAILISSNGYFEDCEAGIIAEWMERDRSKGTYLVRGTKLLERLAVVPPEGLVYQAVSRNPEELRGVLQSVPIAAVILHTTTAKRSYAHQEILRQALETHPEEWERIYEDHRETAGQQHRLVLYRHRRDLQGIPVRLTVDLTRKIGDSVATEGAAAP